MFNEFLVDSGATHNLIRSRNRFTSFTKNTDIRKVKLGSHHSPKVCGKGDVEQTVSTPDGPMNLLLKNTLHVPKIRSNLISVSQLTDDDYNVEFKNDELTIQKENLELKVSKESGLYRLQVDGRVPDQRKNADECDSALSEVVLPGCHTEPPSTHSEVMPIGTPRTLNLIHRKFAHINEEYVQRFVDRNGVKYTDNL